MKIKLLILLMMTFLGTTSVLANSCDIKIPGADPDAISDTVSACEYVDKELALSKEDTATLNATLAKCKCDVDNKEIAEATDPNGAHCASGRTTKDLGNGKVKIIATPGSTVIDG